MAMTKDEKIKLYEELMEDKDFLHEMNKKEQADLKYGGGEMAYAKDKGMKEGFEQGKLNIAKNLKSLDISIDDIAKITCLSIDEIKNYNFSIIF
ncbi:hypothetical protein [Methanobrevibacter arboriphilus]|uniref:hypothetical protein n=1 Tax=Methanobrevibacter arboriphilus TaxID=39441 RepID=UPI0006D298CC|nr:hypothetical protein [Methanobrevibacter arboriphilus]